MAEWHKCSFCTCVFAVQDSSSMGISRRASNFLEERVMSDPFFYFVSEPEALRHRDVG